jgi:hypothetical protein
MMASRLREEGFDIDGLGADLAAVGTWIDGVERAIGSAEKEAPHALP